ncbi:MAG: PAS domain-containing sensor histidine kinase [Acidimicrobiia bacterium]
MSTGIAARTERGQLIMTLLRVRAFVYVAAGVPILFMPDATTAAIVFGISSIVIASVTPFAVRYQRASSGVRSAAASDLVVAYGMWLFMPELSGISLMLVMWAVAYAVFLGSRRDGRGIAILAAMLQLSKLLVISIPALSAFPVVPSSSTDTMLIIGGTAAIVGAHFAFRLIDRYFAALNDAAATGEERYRRLMDTAAVGFIVIVHDTIRYANVAARRMLDPAGASLDGRPMSDHIAPSSISVFAELEARVIKLLETVDDAEMELVDAEGSSVWVDISANAVDYGDDLAMQLMVHDRSDQVKAEAQLAKTRLDYVSFFERIPVALYRTHPDGRIAHVNDALVELLGAQSHEDIIHRDARSFYDDESDRDRVTEMLRLDGMVVGYEWKMRTLDGSTRWVRDTVRLIDSPRGAFYEGALVDVTTRRAVEDELWSRAVQQEAAASVGQFALETEDVPLLCGTISDVVTEVLGTDGVAVLRRDSSGMFELVGSSPGLRVDATTLSGIADRTHMAGAPVLLRSEAEIRFAAPGLLDLGYCSAIALMVPGKEIDFGTLVVLSRRERVFSADDLNFLYSVTNVLAAAVDRAGVYQRLEALVASKDAFVASVSHELRTPLTVVSGLAQELRTRWMSLSDEEMDEFTMMLVAQSQDMADLIEDLLVAARSNIGNVAVQIMAVDVKAEVTGVLSGFASQTSRPISSDVPAVEVAADPNRLRQILRNLVSNALRYGGDEIFVRGAARSGVLAIEVCDTGDPIDEADVERIFEPYERAHESAGRPGSVGLGLAVSRTLAELMHGSLTYYHDGMSVFRLELPASQAKLEASPHPFVGEHEPVGTFGAIGPGRVGVDVAAIQ